MSKKILIPTGILSLLGAAAYSLSVLNSSSDIQEPSQDIPERVDETIFVPTTQKPQTTTPVNEIKWEVPVWDKDGLPFDEYRTESYDVKAFQEAYKKAQPIRASWKQNRNNKSTSYATGKKNIYLLRDYTFRFFNRCTGGTLWILDYELPTEPNKYPTKFFFGTNAHVIQGIKFKDNPYDQVLPQRACQVNWGMLVRETNLEAGGYYDFAPDRWNPKDVGLFWIPEKNDVNRWLDKDYDPLYYRYTFEDPKLVYLATDFAGYSKDKWEDRQYSTNKYLSDFAVIEVDFKTEKIARKMTRDFHDKYHHKNGTLKDEAINFFAKPLMERKTNKELYEESIDFYVAGYPVNGLHGRSVGSYNATRQQASKLTYYPTGQMIKEENSDDDIFGHVNASLQWGHLDAFEEPRASRGVMIVLEHERLANGSSGSLTIDGERNAIGVKSRKSGPAAEIDVFRSVEIKRHGKTIIPKYDLLEGVDGDPDSRSYRDSVEKFMLPKKRRTHLSDMRSWKARNE